MNRPDIHRFTSPAAPAFQSGHAAQHGKTQRWRIWAEQEHPGHEPCFRTERRFFCQETQCPWCGDCLSLHAEWRR